MPEIQQTPTAIKPDQIIEIALRQRWIIIISLCVTLTVGLYFTLTLPRTYSSSTTILVQAQKVPGSYVRSIVSTELSERISTISQQIMSQTNLEKIIDQFGLYEDEGAQNMYLEDKIKSMRKRINVTLSRARSGTDAFTISFTGKEPDRVMRIANTLASFFMDENLKLREAQAVGTSEFLDSELEKTRQRLEEREKALSDYRSRYLGGLPDELESNLRTMDRLQLQLTEKQAMLRDAKNSLNTLTAQIAQSKEMSAQSMGDPFAFSDFEEEDGLYESETASKIAQLEKIYDSLLLRYTERHPDAVKVARTIDKLKKNLEKENAEREAQAEKESEEIADDDNMELDIEMPLPEGNWAVMQQEMQLSQINDEILKIESDIAGIQEKMLVYQQRVEATPKREQELLSLKRDYGNIQDVFSSLLSRKLEAELSVNMEKKQKGEQFRILDHARLPEKPISPDVKKLLIFSLAAGLGLSGGIIFLFELLNLSVRRDGDIEEKLGLPILAHISRLKEPGYALKKRLNWLCFGAASMYASCVLGFFVVINQKGITKVVDFIKSFI